MSLLTKRQFTAQCERAELVSRNTGLTTDVVMVRRRNKGTTIAIIGHMIPREAADFWRSQGWKVRTLCRYHQGARA